MKIKDTNIRKVFKVHKNTNALRVTIPETICFRMNIKQGDEVKLTCSLDGEALLITKTRRKKNGTT